MMREVQNSAPKRLYLVAGDQCPADAQFHELTEVTWCEQDIDGNGIEYATSANRKGLPCGTWRRSVTGMATPYPI